MAQNTQLRGFNPRKLTEKEERERLAMMQAQMDAMRWRTAGQVPGSAAYTGDPNLGLEDVYPELLLGGPATLAARGVAKAAPGLMNLARRAIKHIDPVTGNRVVRPGIQKAIATARNSIVRPGHAGGTRGPFVRTVTPGRGRGKWATQPTVKITRPTSAPFGPRPGWGSYALGAGGAAAALMDGDETPTVKQALLADMPTATTTPTVPTTAVADGLLADATTPNVDTFDNFGAATSAGGLLDAATTADKSGYEGFEGGAIPTVVEEEAVVADTERSYQIPDPDASTVGKLDVSQIAPEKKQELERVWGKYTYSPKERHNKFMEQLNSIYMKAAWLDVIASITGGTSQSAQYISRATSKLEMMAKFDQEERLYNIWRDVYHDENGTYDPPKSKKEAAERARRLGASPEETQKIYGWGEDQDDLVSWWRPADNEKKYEVKTTHGKKESPARGTGADWIMGSPPDSLTAPVAKTPVGHVTWTDGTNNTSLLKGQAGPPGYWKGTATTAGSDSMWAVPPGGGAAQYVLKSRVASEEGWTKSTQIQGNRLERAIDRAEAHLKGAGGESAARSELKIFFSSDAMSYLMFAKNIEKTVDDQIANIKAARIAPIGAPDNRDDAEKALRVAKPKPDDVSLEDYEAAIKEALDRLYPGSS